MMFIFVLIIGYIMYASLKDLSLMPTSHSNDRKSLEVLRTKFANSEITEEEYLKRKQIIER